MTIGPYRLPDEIEAAVLTTLWHWLPTYLADTERKAGVTVGTTIGRPQRWKIIASWDDLDTDNRAGWPALAVISPGPQDLVRNAQGSWDGWYRVAVGIAVQGEDRRLSRITASRLLWAALMVLLDHQELRADADHQGAWSWSASHPPRAEAVRIDVAPDLTETPPSDRRNRAAAVVELGFFVRDIVSAGEGPAAAAGNAGTDPLDPWPSATGVDIDITIDGSIEP